MIYLDSITFPDADEEWAFRLNVKRTCYNTMYPFGVLSAAGLQRLDFEPITILYGGNGSGKTTALNVIAEKLGLARETPFNRSSFFDDYVRHCRVSVERTAPAGSRIVTSDDVFDYMLGVRCLNDGIDRRREELFVEHTHARHSQVRVRSLDDYDALKKQNSARRHTQSAFVREQLMENVREQSNGESAAFFFRQRVDSRALRVPARRAGEQSLARAAGGACAVPGGGRTLRGLPADHLDALAVSAVDARGQGLRSGRAPGDGPPLDAPAGRARLLRFFHAAPRAV